MDINALWNEVLNNCGKTFYTKTRLPFTYERVDSLKVRVNRQGSYVGYINKTDLEFILNNPNEDRHVYRDNMRTSSYALALYDELVNN